LKGAALMLTAFGLGHMRPASGTWGSTPPAAVALLLAMLLGLNGLGVADRWIINGVLVLLVVVFSYACVAWGDWAEAWYGKKDPGQVVADEVAGQAVALLVLPWRAIAEDGSMRWEAFWFNIIAAATAFFAFRFFDIVKPSPARQLQAWPSGWGILIDDLFAGGYALIATQLVVRYVWGPLLIAGPTQTS
jgi:phosphatidylglycerophosphatase A